MVIVGHRKNFSITILNRLRRVRLLPVAGRPTPVDVDMSWHMNEGPGRQYYPGMFPIINQIVNNRYLAPGTYNLRDFVPTEMKGIHR
jgi:hypothetical protein